MSRPGSGGVASASLSDADRRERLRLLALETVDLKNVILFFTILSF